MSDQKDGSQETEVREPASVDSDRETEDVDFEEEPIGASPDEVAESLDTAVGSGALAEVVSQYSPDQFNDLIESLTDEYRVNMKRQYRFRLYAMLFSVLLVCGLFAGLLWFSMSTNRSGGAVIFFAGSIAGYFMRLATDLA